MQKANCLLLIILICSFTSPSKAMDDEATAHQAVAQTSPFMEAQISDNIKQTIKAGVRAPNIIWDPEMKKLTGKKAKFVLQSLADNSGGYFVKPNQIKLKKDLFLSAGLYLPSGEWKHVLINIIISELTPNTTVETVTNPDYPNRLMIKTCSSSSDTETYDRIDLYPFTNEQGGYISDPKEPCEPELHSKL